jgi:enoyl-CoA hydratase
MGTGGNRRETGMSVLQIKDREGVREVMLDRPSKRNALSPELLSALRDALSTPDMVRAVILAAAPPVFSAGADLDALAGTAADIAFDDAVESTARCIRNSSVPIIAAIEGPCIGAALELALACDMRVAGEQAYFEFPPLKLGILYNPASIRRMHQLLPRATLSRVLLGAERLNACDAVAAGVATHFAGEQSALDIAREIAARMTGLDREALTATRQLLRELDAGASDLSAFAATRTALLDSPRRREELAKRRRSNGTS